MVARRERLGSARLAPVAADGVLITPR